MPSLTSLLDITLDKQSEDAFMLTVKRNGDGAPAHERTQVLNREQIDALHDEAERIRNAETERLLVLIHKDEYAEEDYIDATHRLPFLSNEYTAEEIGEINAYYWEIVLGLENHIADTKRWKAEAQAMYNNLVIEDSAK